MKYSGIFALLGGMTLSFCFLTNSTAGRVLAVYLALNLFAYAAAYALRGPRLFRKRPNGTIPPVNFLIFAPLHLLNWLSLLVAIRVGKEQPYHEIPPEVWLGRRLVGREAAGFAGRSGIAVLDLTCEFAENRQLREESYICLPVLDHTAPTKEQIGQALAFLDRLAPGTPVYVHCALGHGRSATVAAAWLLHRRLALNLSAAVARLQAVRRGVKLDASQLKLLQGMFPEETRA